MNSCRNWWWRLSCELGPLEVRQSCGHGQRYDSQGCAEVTLGGVMKRGILATLVTLVTSVAVAPSALAYDSPLEATTGNTYGMKITRYTGCWDSPSSASKPRLEAKVDGRWVTYDSSGTFVKRPNLCEAGYPYIVKYTWVVKDEGTPITVGKYAGWGLLLMRESYLVDGKREYDYYKTYVAL